MNLWTEEGLRCIAMAYGGRAAAACEKTHGCIKALSGDVETLWRNAWLRNAMVKTAFAALRESMVQQACCCLIIVHGVQCNCCSMKLSCGTGLSCTLCNGKANTASCAPRKSRMHKSCCCMMKHEVD